MEINGEKQTRERVPPRTHAYLCIGGLKRDKPDRLSMSSFGGSFVGIAGFAFVGGANYFVGDRKWPAFGRTCLCRRSK